MNAEKFGERVSQAFGALAAVVLLAGGMLGGWALLGWVRGEDTGFMVGLALALSTILVTAFMLAVRTTKEQ